MTFYRVLSLIKLNVCAGLQVRPKPFTSRLPFQVQPVSETLKVNRLKWQSWTLLHSALMESGEQVKDKTVVRQQLAPHLNNHLCRVIPLALCHRDSCVVFGPFVVESHQVMDGAPLNEDEPLPVCEKVSALCVFALSAVLPPLCLLLEGPAIYPDLVSSGNISTSPLCWT